jgi:hypothetical protein
LAPFTGGQITTQALNTLTNGAFAGAQTGAITGGEKFFDRFRGGSFYTVWCIFAAGIGILVVQMLLRR